MGTLKTKQDMENSIKIRELETLKTRDPREEAREALMSCKPGEDQSKGTALRTKLAELNRVKDELKKAKEAATKSWLDSRPYIDELEKLKDNLAHVESKTTMSGMVISELELKIEKTCKDIQSKKEEEQKASKKVDEVKQALDQTRFEIQRLTVDMDEEQREQTELGMILKGRKQKLQTLQLMLRAVKMESEALEESEARVVQVINLTEADTAVVQLNRKDYYALTKTAEEQISLADWRITVSDEQKLATEVNRDLSFSKLQRLRRKMREKQKIAHFQKQENEAKIVSSTKVEVNGNVKLGKLLSHSDKGKAQNKLRTSTRTMKSKNKMQTMMGRFKQCLCA